MVILANLSVVVVVLALSTLRLDFNTQVLLLGEMYARVRRRSIIVAILSFFLEFNFTGFESFALVFNGAVSTLVVVIDGN